MINCCNNLNRNYSLASPEGLTEDVTTTVTIGTSSTAILAANVNRRLVKLYLTSLSESTECWIRYGAGATLANSAHILPLRHLLIVDGAQARNVISLICSSGTAQLRVSTANAL